ncbi:MAG TPA: TIGR00282 family metallophosphoesterase [Firmicutes bacterium]|nr:TIGR00282 family metallophosphoesterase [Bacillota bacterium]
MFRVLFIGDVVGAPGLAALRSRLKALVARYGASYCIVNADNLAEGGRGLSRADVECLLALGVDVITTGNHVWRDPEIHAFIEREKRLLRPLNLRQASAGQGLYRRPHPELSAPICTLQLSGRVFMNDADCPFLAADQVLADKSEGEVVIVDFHAEATSEKVALGWYLDGRVSAVVGTHTHVQTADERILPGGTAYITDTGMTGPHDSVLGFDKEIIIPRFVHDKRQRFRVAQNDVRICGVVIDIDPATTRAHRIIRFAECLDDEIESKH